VDQRALVTKEYFSKWRENLKTVFAGGLTRTGADLKIFDFLSVFILPLRTFTRPSVADTNLILV
jgi:hypothetical protein